MILNDKFDNKLGNEVPLTVVFNDTVGSRLGNVVLFKMITNI